jgi:thiol:disulfide interchange protein DsbD
VVGQTASLKLAPGQPRSPGAQVSADLEIVLPPGARATSLEVEAAPGSELVSATVPSAPDGGHSDRISVPVTLRPSVEGGAIGVVARITLAQSGLPVELQASLEAPSGTGSGAAGLAGWLLQNFEAKNYALIVVAAVVVGLLLCLTPCVYPMIPITVGYFSNQTAESRGARLLLGAMYMAGIATTYGAVGGVFAVIGQGVGALFTQRWFLFSLAGLMAVLALSMFGVYEIGVPRFVGKRLKGRAGPVGALVMGLLMGFAAAPCAGALVSAVAIGVADTGSIPLGVTVFTAIGLGLGLPFFALASLSSGASQVLPRSGGWLKTVKAILGLAVLWLAADYLFKGLGWRSGEPQTLLGWFVFFLLGAAYLLFFDRTEPSKAVQVLKGGAAMALGLMAGSAWEARSVALLEQRLETDGSPRKARIQWTPWTEAAFEEAKASGKPILIDAWAEWCTECKVIEKTVLDTPEGVQALQGFVTMKIDWSTGQDPEYIDATAKKFGIVGLPHLMFFKPGGALVRTVHELRSVQDLEHLAREARP